MHTDGLWTNWEGDYGDILFQLLVINSCVGLNSPGENKNDGIAVNPETVLDDPALN